MLRNLYHSLDRRRRPLRERHYLVFRSYGLIYARIPGDPYTTMMPLIAHLAGVDASNTAAAARSGQNGIWGGDVELMTAREVKKRHPDYSVFAVVQRPEERLARAYESLICDHTADLPTYFCDRQFNKSMTMEEFVAKISLLSDMSADNMFRSQSSMLSYRGQLVPDLIYSTDQLRHETDELFLELEKRSAKTLDLSGVHLHVGYADDTRASFDHSPDTIQKIRLRYESDYRQFFSKTRRSNAASKPLQPVASLVHS